MDDGLFYIGVKALVEGPKGKILLLKTKARHHVAKEPYWDIPGGRVLEGEGFEQTLEREFLEETGLELPKNKSLFSSVISNHISTYNGSNPKFNGLHTGLILVVYKIQISENIPIKISNEHLAYEWVSKKEAAKRLMHKYPKEFTNLL